MDFPSSAGSGRLVLFIAAGGEIVQRLWNWLVPSIVGWRQITFWQALGILTLCRILFGGFGCHGSPRSGVRHRVKDRWNHMSPEEQESFRQGIRSRCGFGPAPKESESQ